MTLRGFRVLVLLLASALVAVACESAGVEGPDIPVQDPSLVAAGAPLYESNCAECHGNDLRGTNLGPSHLSIVYAPDHHTDFAFERAITFGTPQHHWSFGPMEPVAGLGTDQITAITAFVRESQRVEGFEAYPPT